MTNKSITDLILESFPDLKVEDFMNNGIWLQNDSDETGDYIAKWDYSKPIPESLLSYKR